jgi:hypothetical protein
MGWVVSVTSRPRFTPWKGVPIGQEAAWPQKWSGHWGYRKIPLSLPGIKPRSPGLQSRHYTDWAKPAPSTECKSVTESLITKHAQFTVRALSGMHGDSGVPIIYSFQISERPKQKAPSSFWVIYISSATKQKTAKTSQNVPKDRSQWRTQRHAAK